MRNTETNLSATSLLWNRAIRDSGLVQAAGERKHEEGVGWGGELNKKGNQRA